MSSHWHCGCWCPGMLLHNTWAETTRTTAFWGSPPPPPWLPILLSHIRSQVKRKSQSYKFKEFAKIELWNKLYMLHTFWSCLIRCAYMKWIDEYCWRYRARFCPRTDGQGETSIPPFQLRYIIMMSNIWLSLQFSAVKVSIPVSYTTNTLTMVYWQPSHHTKKV